MAGFENDVCVSTNVNFDTAAARPHLGIMDTAGQVLIATGSADITIEPEIVAGFITSPNSSINVGYSNGNITIDTGAQAALVIHTDSGSASPVANILNMNGAGNATVSAVGNSILITSSGGAGSTVNFNVDTGSSPVSPIANLVTLTGSSVAAGTNPLRTNGTGSNNIAFEVQRSQAIIAQDTTKVGMCNFSNSQFVVTNGFVTLAGGSSAPNLTISDDVDTAVMPDGAGNIQLTGHVVNAGGNFSTTVSSPGSNLIAINPMSTVRWIVDPLGFNGTHTTIASAMASATAGETIQLLSAVYTENYTHKPGVNICANACDAYTPNVTIKGKITMTGTGTASISGVQLETNGDNFLEITGSNTLELNFVNCFIDIVDFTGIDINNANAMVNFYQCKGDIATTGISFFNITDCTRINFEYCYFDNSGDSVTPNAIASGMLRHWWSRFNNPVSITGDANIAHRWSRIETSDNDVTALTLNTSNTDCNSFHCVYTSGTATCIVVTAGTIRIIDAHISTTNTNAITGAGTINMSGMTYRNSSQVTTTTQNFFPEGPRIALGGTGNAQLMCGSGSPSGSVTAPKGSVYFRTDGSSSSTRAYINTNSGTGWTAITTAS